MIKKENGITLIALVITIIVLLILAAVTIAMLTGENGILTKATKSSKDTRESAIKESLSLASSTITANKLDPSYVGDLNTFGSQNVAKVIKADDANTEAADVDDHTDEGTGTGAISYKYSGKTYNVTFNWLYATGKEETKKVDDIIGIDLDHVTIEEKTAE